MAYCTAAEVKSAWNDISDTEIGTTRVAEAIVRADAIIDSYIASRYSVPLSTTPPLLNGISINIALYWCKKWKDPRIVTEVDEWLYRGEIELLENIQQGKMSLTDSDGLISALQTAEAIREDYPSIFDVDDEDQHEVDDDLLDDIEDARD